MSFMQKRSIHFNHHTSGNMNRSQELYSGPRSMLLSDNDNDNDNDTDNDNDNENNANEIDDTNVSSLPSSTKTNSSNNEAVPQQPLCNNNQDDNHQLLENFFQDDWVANLAFYILSLIVFVICYELINRYILIGFSNEPISDHELLRKYMHKHSLCPTGTKCDYSF